MLHYRPHFQADVAGYYWPGTTAAAKLRSWRALPSLPAAFEGFLEIPLLTDDVCYDVVRARASANGHKQIVRPIGRKVTTAAAPKSPRPS